MKAGIAEGKGKNCGAPAHDCGVVAALAISAASYASRFDLRLFVSNRLKPYCHAGFRMLGLPRFAPSRTARSGCSSLVSD